MNEFHINCRRHCQIISQLIGKHMTNLAYLWGVVRDVPSLLLLLWPYVCSVLLFISFLLWNGSVVLRDKSHHQAAVHLPQVFYFFTFACGFAGVVLLSQLELIVSYWTRFRRIYWIALLCILIVASLLSVHYFT